MIPNTTNKRLLSRARFLTNILILAVSAFGGPQSHLAMMFDLLVYKRRYITEQDLLELNTFCQLLPGPTSTQVITAIGYRLGGTKLAFLTLFVWVFPACICMTLAAITYDYLSSAQINLEFLTILQPISIAFVFVAALRVSRVSLKRPISYAIALCSALLAIYLGTPYIYPLTLVLGGACAYWFQREKTGEFLIVRSFKVNWSVLYLFIGLFLFVALIGNLTRSRPILLMEHMYRFGSLVFGGGQVLVPMMYEQFVEYKQYLTTDQFLTGYGIAQAIPGPVFAFSAYVNALAMKPWGIWGMVLGAFLGSVSIFLPGALLIFFMYPIWKQARELKVIKKSLDGINAAATGLIFASAIILMKPIGWTHFNITAVLITMAVLLFTKIPSVFVIFIGLVIDWFFWM